MHTIPQSVLSVPDHRIPPAANGYVAHKPRKYHWYASRYLNAISILVVGALTLLRLYRVLERRRRLRLWRERGSVPNDSYVGWSLFPRSVNQTVHRSLFLTSVAEWTCSPDTIADALFSGLYCSLLLFFSFNNTGIVSGPLNMKAFANQLGVMSFSQLPFIVLLVMKNNPISALTGISYQKLNYLHRAASRACLLCCWLHALVWTPRIWAKSQFSRGYIVWGLIALFSFTMLWSTSLRVVRRAAWEFFFLTHIVFTFLFLVGAIVHWKKLAYWVWPALALWLLDRLIRLSKLQLSAGSQFDNAGDLIPRSTVEMVAPNLLKVTVCAKNMRWTAGQHAFLSSPSITTSPHEQHPFSFANVPDLRNHHRAIFLVRVHSGATRMLHNALISQGDNIPVIVEGPYGPEHHFDVYDTVMLFAGGTGITFCLSHTLSLIQRAQTIVTKRIHLIWHIRRQNDAHWIYPLLNDWAGSINCKELVVHIDLYITRGRVVMDNPVKPDERYHVRWHHGRAVISDIIAHEVSQPPRRVAARRVAVAACGPRSLLQAARTAVASVSVLESLDYYEETLGA